MYLTRQDHIDPRIRGIHPSPTKCGGTVVEFVEVGYVKGGPAIWMCSCGHSMGEVPNLRRSDLDPMEWVRAHPLEIAKSIDIEICPAHEIGERWRLDGHLWFDGPNKILTLCLPNTMERQR